MVVKFSFSNENPFILTVVFRYFKHTYMSHSLIPDEAFYSFTSNVYGFSKGLYDAPFSISGHLDVAKRVYLEGGISRIVWQARAIGRLEVFDEIVPQRYPQTDRVEGRSEVITSQAASSNANSRSLEVIVKKHTEACMKLGGCVGRSDMPILTEAARRPPAYTMTTPFLLCIYCK